jgi:hypothetical protein
VARIRVTIDRSLVLAAAPIGKLHEELVKRADMDKWAKLAKEGGANLE